MQQVFFQRFSCSTLFNGCHLSSRSSHRPLFQCWILLIGIFCTVAASTQTDLLDDWFDKVTDPSAYKKWIRPHSATNKPLVVNISLHLYTVASLDEVTTEYSAQLLLRLSWMDPRLRDDRIRGEITEGNEFYLDRIWTPLLHVPNNRESDPIANTKHTLFRIKTTGEILTSKRIKLRVFCVMNLHNFPLDRQTCDIAFESSSLPMREMQLHWCDTDPVHLTKTFHLLGYDLRNVSLLEGVSHFKQTGNFSKVIVRFEISRRFGQFLLDVYIPTALFVITSWISFWIEIPAAPARVTLGMTTMLTLVTSARSAREKLPRVSYIHALDIWIVTCTCFIFASLVEYAAVNHIYYKDKRCKKRRALQNSYSSASFLSLSPEQLKGEDNKSFNFLNLPIVDTNNKQCCPPSPNSAHDYHPSLCKPRFSFSDSVNTLTAAAATSSSPSSTCSIQIDGCPINFRCNTLINTQDLANSIDRKCRIIYPMLFFIFNLIYWSIICTLD